AIEHKVSAGYSVDQFLVCRRELGVGGDRKLARLFDRGRAATEIEEQILYGSRWHHFPVVGGGETRRNKIGAHWESDTFVAGKRARCQRRKICGFRDTDLDGRLSRFLPSDARCGIAALGDIDQLDEAVDVIGADPSG